MIRRAPCLALLVSYRLSVVTETSFKSIHGCSCSHTCTLGWLCVLPTPFNFFRNFLAVLVMEPKASYMLDRSSITKPHSQPTSYASVLLHAYLSLP